MRHKYYKVLNADGSCCHGGSGRWVVGKPMPRIEGKLIPCQHGYHILSRNQVIFWLGEAIHPVIDTVDVVAGVDKCVCRSATALPAIRAWNKKTQLLFAADCAEHVCHIVPDALRVAADWAIDVVRRYAREEADVKEVLAAAIASSDASAARSAASSAAYAACAACDACSASAASSAAYAACAASAASSAASRAARNAERKWQSKRLWAYLDGKIE